MTRGLSAVQNTYLAGDSLIGITLIYIAVNGGTDLYYTDAPFDIDYDGDTYEAQGKLIGISESQEVAELQITNITLTLTALDLTLVQTIATSAQINQDVLIYRAFLNPTTNELIGDSSGDQVVPIFKGKINSYTIKDSDDTATISLDIKSQFSNFTKSTGRRTNVTSLQNLTSLQPSVSSIPNDFGFEYSHETLRDLRWGKKS